VKAQWPSPITGEALAERFSGSGSLSFGIEEEIMALDPVTLDLLPEAPELIEGLDERFKTELPASQLEIATNPSLRIDALAAQLLDCRTELAGHLGNRARLCAAGVHPFTERLGVLNSGERYDRLLAEYGDVLRQQLVCGLHLHVGLSGPERALAVYNAMRSYLPEISALAANAPVQCGRDTTLASVRPLISGLLPRMGIPPALSSWDEYADQLNWGVSTERMGRPAEWWWELRLHAGLGTLEVRVPDAQATVRDAVAVCTFAAGICSWLAARHDAGDLPEPAASWRINENRWSALRRGVDATLIDLRTGSREPARRRLERLFDEVAPFAREHHGSGSLDVARKLAERNGAEQQREVFRAEGARALTEWLADRFLEKQDIQ
jgi:carboxylate-amine ligase